MTEWILTSSVLILLVLAVRGLFKNKMKAKAVYALWLIVLVRLLCPVNFGELSFNLLSLAEEGKAQVQELLEIRQTEEQQELQQEIWQSAKQEFLVSEGTHILPENTVVYYPTADGSWSTERTEVSGEATSTAAPETKTEAPATVPAAEKNGFSLPEISWQQILPYVWIAGMALMALVIFGVNLTFSTTLGMFRKELPLLARKGRGKQELSVYLADGIISSCLYGVVRPSIYLNKNGMNEQEKTYCVEHEYSHYLQGDMVWSLCRILCLILHWYNPLVWVAVMLSKKDAELACDERTIERLGEEERFSYGHALVELAANQSKAVQMFGMATLMAPDKKEVVERVKAIANKKQTKLVTGLLVAALVVGMGFFVFTGEAKGEQDNNTNEVAQVTETPVPTKEAEPEPTEALTPVPTAVVTKEEAGITPEPTPMPEIVSEVWYNAQDPYFFREYVLESKEFPVQGQVAVNYLNVRTGAGRDHKSITALKKNTEVTILGITQVDDEYWYEISFNEEHPTAYVLSSYIAWAGSFRLYEEPEEDSAYITVDYCSDVIRGVADAGSDWFYAETADCQSGWVRYGEHGGVDGSIRDILWFTESEWELVREKKKEENLLTLTEDVKYAPLSFVDHVALEPVSGEGWLVDLNGDGKEEQLYINGNGVYINGEKEFVYAEPWSFWLLDIDTTDAMYELTTGSGTMYIYDGKDFRKVKGVDAYLVPEESAGNGTYFMKRQIATLNAFTRIDEHTISFKDYFHDWLDFFAEAQYTLDENHYLQVVPQEYEIQVVEQQISTLLYGVDYYKDGVPGFLVSEIRVYTEKSLDSSYTEEMWLENVTLSKSDCVEWIYAETADGISGWLYYDKNRPEEYLITHSEAE